MLTLAGASSVIWFAAMYLTWYLKCLKNTATNGWKLHIWASTLLFFIYFYTYTYTQYLAGSNRFIIYRTESFWNILYYLVDSSIQQLLQKGHQWIPLWTDVIKTNQQILNSRSRPLTEIITIVQILYLTDFVWFDFNTQTIISTYYTLTTLSFL